MCLSVGPCRQVYLPQFFHDSAVRTMDANEADVFLIPNTFHCRLVAWDMLAGRQGWSAATTQYFIPLLQCVSRMRLVLFLHKQ
jgi:hypothetical protein